MEPGSYVAICVADTGTGMSPEVMARVFEPFFTTKPLGQGTGLGLSMVYGFARQSGGHVRIESREGVGTVVRLYLPRHKGGGSADAAPPTQAEDQIPAGAATVLVVDDEPVVRMLVCEVLSELGYVALEAHDGPEGLRILGTDARIDLLVTDVGLPGGINGRQLADAAQVLRPELKVLFITGYAETAAIGDSQLAPGMEVVTKPFELAALAARIRGMMEAWRELYNAGVGLSGCRQALIKGQIQGWRLPGQGGEHPMHLAAMMRLVVEDMREREPQGLLHRVRRADRLIAYGAGQRPRIQPIHISDDPRVLGFPRLP